LGISSPHHPLLVLFRPHSLSHVFGPREQDRGRELGFVGGQNEDSSRASKRR